MPEQHIHIDELIIGFLSGEATGEEQQRLLSWIESDNEHRLYYEQMRRIWKGSAQLGRLSSSQIDTSLRKVHQKMSPVSGAEKRKQVRNTPKVLYRLYKYAAAVILFALASYGLAQYYIHCWMNDQAREIVYEAPYGSRAFTILPDGSEVWLNSGSKLSFFSAFNYKERHIHLEGEAYFNVKTNPEKPFVVKVGDFSIKATGTIFNVKAYPEENEITTTLVEGTVFVEGKDMKERMLRPNQSVSYYKDIRSVTATDEAGITGEETVVNEEKQFPKLPVTIEVVKPEIYTSWKDDRWRIENEQFSNLATKLERRYDVKIRFLSDDLMKYRFSGIIEQETLEQIFDIFQYTIPLKYKIEKGVVTLELDEELKKRYNKAWN